MLGQSADLNLKKGQRAPLEIGQNVLIKDGHAQRGQWRLARIDSLEEGRDGQIRKVQLTTPTGKLTRHLNSIALQEGAPLLEHQIHFAKIGHKQLLANCAQAKASIN